MRVGSLFAGVGGFDIAAERVGMEVAWQSEMDRAASNVLDHYWPGKNLGDIHDITQPPAVDVLCGGFPCQDYSVAGNREGLAGDRGALWWEYHRLITEGRPTWVVAENVPGLLSSRNGADFATIIDSLTELGYGVVWGVLDAQYFGVAQRRRRVFIVAHSGGRPRPEILALSEGMSGHPQPRRQTRSDVASTVTTGIGSRNDITADTFISSSGKEVIGSLTTKFGPKNYSNHQEVGAGSLVFKRERSDSFAESDGVATTLTARDYKDHGDLVGTVAASWANGTGTMQVESGFVIPDTPNVRRLTPLECERLQGFPDNWTQIEGNADNQRYKQMGNAVAVPVVKWIMENINGG